MKRRTINCMLLFAAVVFSITAFAQGKRTISGVVTDSANKPLSGISVLIKGTKTGTVTNENGQFSINASSGNVLVFTFVGYRSQELTLGSSSTYNIQMVGSVIQLTDVVVTALGIKREKRSLGYAVSTVNKDELELRPEADLGRVLSGKVPGLDITSTSGLSGSGTNINIRGISTITGNSAPLFVVDGVPFDGSTNAQANFTYGHQTSSRFLDLDPNNIENVSVLKGLTAVTLYGEEGRNGVILVTTKNGATQRTRKKAEITVSQSYFRTKPILPEYNTKYGGGFDLASGIAFFSNWGGPFQNPPELVTHPYDKPTLAAAFPQYQGAPYYYKFYNSIPRFFRTGSTGTTSLNAAGSTPTVNYNMSYSYTDDQGYIINNGLRKNSFGFGGTAKLTNKVTISSTFNYVMTDQKSPPTSNSDGNGPANTSVFGTLLFTPTAVDLMGLPYENPLDHSSIYYRNGNDIQNPRWTLYNAFTKDNVNRIFGQISAMYDIAKGINLMYRVGLDNYTEYQEYSQNKGGVSTPTGILRTSNGVKTIWDQTVLINFNRGLGNDFNLTVNAGGNKRSDLYSQTGQTSEQQLVYGIMNHSNFVTHKETTEDGSPINYDQNTLDLAVFGVASLGYRDYLYMTLGGRNSWKSTVEMNNRSIFYPNVSLSFIPTSAIAAFQNSKTVNYLKLRVGYSTSANFPPPYKTRAFLLTATNVFQTSQGTPININAIPNLLPNPDLKPELLKEAEAGIEGRFFKNRISLDLTFYSRVASNQILDRPLDPSTGYGDVLVNAGQVSNKGIELQLGATIVQTKDWKWELTGLYSLNKSLVSKIPADLKDILIAGYSNEGVYARNGSAYGVIEAPYFEKDPKSGKKIVDPDGNYIISNDIGVVGDPNALYKIAGISTLTYKSFSFGMQWNYTAGGDMYSTTSSALLGRGVTRDTEFDRAKPVILPGVLQTTGQPNNIQVSPTQAYYTNNSTQQLVGEASIFDATCIRLREASLSYNLPQKALAKLPFGSASISISGSNLWYYAPNFPKYVHFDPEAVGLGVGNGRGMEFLSGPSARRFGASIRVTF